MLDMGILVHLRSVLPLPSLLFPTKEIEWHRSDNKLKPFLFLIRMWKRLMEMETNSESDRIRDVCEEYFLLLAIHKEMDCFWWWFHIHFQHHCVSWLIGCGESESSCVGISENSTEWEKWKRNDENENKPPQAIANTIWKKRKRMREKTEETQTTSITHIMTSRRDLIRWWDDSNP